MAKTVTPCVHCGKPVPIDTLDESDLEKALHPLKASANDLGLTLSKLKDEILAGLPKEQPGLGDMCSIFPSLCSKVEALDSKVKEIREATMSHPMPTKEAEGHWLSCPECKPLWEERLEPHRHNAFKKGLDKGLEEGKNRALEEAKTRALEELHSKEHFENCPTCKELSQPAKPKKKPIWEVW